MKIKPARTREITHKTLSDLSRSYFVGLSFLLAESGARRNDERFPVARGKNTCLGSISAGDSLKILKAGNYERDLGISISVLNVCFACVLLSRRVALARVLEHAFFLMFGHTHKAEEHEALLGLDKNVLM